MGANMKIKYYKGSVKSLLKEVQEIRKICEFKNKENILDFTVQKTSINLIKDKEDKLKFFITYLILFRPEIDLSGLTARENKKIISSLDLSRFSWDSLNSSELILLFQWTYGNYKLNKSLNKSPSLLLYESINGVKRAIYEN